MEWCFAVIKINWGDERATGHDRAADLACGVDGEMIDAGGSDLIEDPEYEAESKRVEAVL